MYIHEDAFTLGKEPDKYETGKLLIHLLHSSFNFHLVVCLTTGPKPLPKQAFYLEKQVNVNFNIK
jgi:hypothetical protein